MSLDGPKALRRRRISLSVRVTIWLVISAILPLLVTVFAINEFVTKPSLVDTAQSQLKADAKTRVQLIDTYFQERMFDAETLTQVPSLQEFMALPPTMQMLDPVAYTTDATHASYALAAGALRDKNYTIWTAFDKQNKPILSYPQAQVPQHGQYIVPPEYLQKVQAGNTFISGVYFDQTTKKATVDIYSPIITLKPKAYLGFVRATLKLDNIWNTVKNDQGIGTGSYAFILDENGVRIADANTNRLFQGVDQISDDVKQKVTKEGFYTGSGSITVVSNPDIAAVLHNNNQETTFQTQPAGANEQYQAVSVKAQNVPWNYYVLSPMSTVTATANQELFLTGIVALAVSLLLLVIGLIAGRSLGRPILSSVELLRENSNSLTTLATKQQDAASEQMWVVDSSQVGLQSVQYYTEAMAVAARQLSKTGSDLAQRWGQVSNMEALQALERIVSAANYIENAAQFQDTSTQKLSTALKVATQVTEQLVAGTTSATDAANQMENVVEQLRYVVGK